MRLPGYITAVFLLLLISCGGVEDNSADSSAGMSITLNFPEEYSVDRSTGELYGPSCENCGTAPSYVTSVTLTLSSAEADNQVFDVPLDTGEVSGVVSPGYYTFSVVVKTNIGLTFTGSTTATLNNGTNVEIVINLAVNAPPQDIVCTASDYTPTIGQTVTITCTGTDLDGDPLTFTMRDGRGWTAIGASTRYTVR